MPPPPPAPQHYPPTRQELFNITRNEEIRLFQLTPSAATAIHSVHTTKLTFLELVVPMENVELFAR